MQEKYIYIHATECPDRDSRSVTRPRHADTTSRAITASISRRRARLTTWLVAGHDRRPRAYKRETRVPRSARGSRATSDENRRSRTRRRSSVGADSQSSSDRRGNRAGAVRTCHRSRKTRSNNILAGTSAAARGRRIFYEASCLAVRSPSTRPWSDPRLPSS